MRALPLVLALCLAGCYRHHTVAGDAAPDASGPVTDDRDARAPRPPDAGMDPGPEPPPPGATIVQLTAGRNHFCALTDAGDVYCWGDNDTGQAGARDRPIQPTPSRVHGLPPIAFIAAGSSHTCAVDRDGGVHCWGFSSYGQLGVPDASIPDCGTGANCSRIPLRVPRDGATRRLFGGVHGTCAETTAGAVECWGRDSAVRATPTEALLRPRDLEHGLLHGCALAASGVVRCFGASEFGLLGDEGRGDGVVDLTGVVDVGVGTESACAIDGMDRVFCWGNNWSGALGRPKEELPLCIHGDTGSRCAVGPVQPTGEPHARAISVGDYKTCIIDLDGGVWCWGPWTVDSSVWWCGASPGECDHVSTRVEGVEGAEALITGGSGACALLDTGELRCWGWAGRGGLGDGRVEDTIADRAVPVVGFGG